MHGGAVGLLVAVQYRVLAAGVGGRLLFAHCCSIFDRLIHILPIH